MGDPLFLFACFGGYDKRIGEPGGFDSLELRRCVLFFGVCADLDAVEGRYTPDIPGAPLWALCGSQAFVDLVGDVWKLTG